MTDRNWIGEAQAAFDQSLSGMREGDGFGSPDFWVSRAQAAAAIEAAKQARISNLIAWKQLQATRAATADAGVGLIPLGGTDGISAEIEHALGMDEEDVPAVSAAGVLLSPEEARLAAEAARAHAESVDDYADQFSDVDARLDGGETRREAAALRALAERLSTETEETP